MLGYDEELSRLWATLRQRRTATETTQRFLAETAALLAQSPSRRRSVLVVAPRLLDVDPVAHREFFAAVRATPWLNPVPADTLRQPGSTTTTVQPGSSPTTTLESPLSPPVIDSLQAQRADLLGIASILTAPDAAVTALLIGTDALVATVWRDDPRGWERLRDRQRAAVQELTTGISVRPSAVNFFADSGVLQVTVVNQLDQDVRGLRLILNPEGRASRLRILTQPEPVTIRKNSRTTVRATVEAIAAGTLPVSTRLTTPTGITLGSDATVRVTVQPTNGWAVLAVGALAGVVFLAGLYRTLRGGKPRMTSEELNRIDLT